MLINSEDNKQEWLFQQEPKRIVKNFYMSMWYHSISAEENSGQS